MVGGTHWTQHSGPSSGPSKAPRDGYSPAFSAVPISGLGAQVTPTRSPKASAQQKPRAAVPVLHNTSGDPLRPQGSQRGTRVIPHHLRMDPVTKSPLCAATASQAPSATKSPTTPSSLQEPHAAPPELHTKSGDSLRPQGSQRGTRVIPHHLKMDPVTRSPLTAASPRAASATASLQAPSAVKSPATPRLLQEPHAATPMLHTTSGNSLRPQGSQRGTRVIPQHLRMDPVTGVALAR